MHPKRDKLYAFPLEARKKMTESQGWAEDVQTFLNPEEDLPSIEDIGIYPRNAFAEMFLSVAWDTAASFDLSDAECTTLCQGLFEVVSEYGTTDIEDPEFAGSDLDIAINIIQEFMLGGVRPVPNGQNFDDWTWEPLDDEDDEDDE